MAVTINGTTGIVTPDLGVDGTTLVVDAANDRVGIGQSSPTKKLEVGGGAVSFSPDVAGKHTHEFTTNAANDARYFLRSDTTTKVDIQANGASYFNGGEVLIGTTIDANIKLDVEGSLRSKAATYVAPTSGVGLELYYATGTLNDTPTAYLLSYDRDASAYKKINYDASDHKFRISGTEKFRIDSSGNIGVNCTSGGGKLAILANSSSYEGLELQTPNGDGSGEFHIGVHQNGSTSGRTIVFRRGGADGMDTESLRIDYAGRLLLGTANAGSNGTADDLVVANNGSASDQAGITIRGGTSGRSQIFFSDGTSGQDEYRGMLRYDHSDNSMQFRTNAVEKFRITSGGNIGVGADNPQATLQVGAGFNSNNGTLLISADNSLHNYIRFTNGGGTESHYPSGIWYQPSGRMELRAASSASASNAAQLVLASNGFIGSGTANPRRQFHLHETASATVGFQMTNAGTGEANDSQGFQLKVASDGHAEIAQMENSNLRVFTNATERLRITSSGQLNVGNNLNQQSYLFSVCAGGSAGATPVVFENNHAGHYGGLIVKAGIIDRECRLQSAWGDSFMTFYTEGSGQLAERLRISSDGLVRVGHPTANYGSNLTQDLEIKGRHVNTAGDFSRLIFGNSDDSGGSTASIRAERTGNNYGTELKFFTNPQSSGGDGLERLRINRDGYVTKPMQPGFYARRSTVGDNRAAGAQEWSVSGTGSYNRGNHFNASNGRFTAPVAGVYFFSAAPGYKQTGSNFSFSYRVNGVIIAEPVRFVDGGDDLTSHSLATGTIAISLTAGQYVDLYIGNSHHANVTLNFFCGYLLG